ncbi:electron transfer flavoprotein subunit alpha [Acidianus sulfidivorans JP7]|uniref:Electron transfer flavoprotein subunit alpha n=1 Tax=Acidianus sulfidivorans JP7 TaxID=619593 RepID=A0A2U9IQQ4_9CREN|nr:FAD-binding protein [Acidianus sulfidivorans]AWR98355.1 electron transfer flavoprotein subunit alpha [Acidianus sulfidivorans JP7]
MEMVKVIVSIKQVPDADDLRVDPVTNTLVREGVPAVINPPDLHAIEEAVRVKEKYGGETAVITMGPPQAEASLREAISMGIDKAYLITDRALAGADTWATSYTLFKAIKKIGEADLYIFGRRAVDGETEQVGPQTAKWLGIPIVGYVSKIEKIDMDNHKLIVVRTTEFDEETVEVPLPAVITVNETINKPRQPDIMSIINSKLAKVIKLNKDDINAEPNKIGLAGSPTKVIKVHPPPKTRNPEIFQAKDSKEAADWIISKIKKSLITKEENTSYQKPNPVTKVNGEVWVYVDHISGEPNEASWEIMGEARRIADLMSTKLAAVIIGANLEKEAFLHGADKVYKIKTSAKRYDNDIYTRALSKIAKKYKPEAIFFPGTKNSRELASTSAIEIDTGLIADCTSFEVDPKGILNSTRPDFGGKEMSTIICPTSRPVMVTVRAGVFKPINERKEGELIEETLEDEFSRYNILEYRKIEKKNELAEADIVVGVGRGIKSPENIKLAEELASTLGGVVGVTKPLADMGWYPKERQVGQTGNTIRPKVYIALGISGAVQHLVGISGSKRIIAINNDPEAPIFENCDYGVVGDLFEIVPEIIKRWNNEI